MPVTASVEGGYLKLYDKQGDGIAVWGLADLRLILDRGVRGVVLCAVHQPDARLTLSDPTFLTVLRAVKPGYGGPIRQKRQIGRGVVYGICAVVSLVLLFAVVLPRFAGALVSVMPPAFEQRLGRQLLPIMAAQFGFPKPQGEAGICSGAEGQAAIDRLVARLSAAKPTRIPITVHVVNGHVMNAFSLPGGQVVVLRGLIDFVSGPTEFAGVLGHEMGHSQFAHPLQHLVESTFVSLSVGFLMGDVVGVSSMVVMAQSLLTTAYSRKFEAVADQESLNRLQAAGIGTVAFLDFMKRLRDDTAMPAILSTHPAPGDRVRAMADRVRPGAVAMTPPEWESVRHMCDGPKPPPQSAATPVARPL